MVSPKIVRSLGWDPGHHEELRNGPEIKKTYMESGFQGYRKSSGFFGIVPEGSRRFRRVPWWGPPIPEGPTWTKGWRTMALHGPGAPAPLWPMRLGIRDKIKSLKNRGERLGGQVGCYSALGLGGQGPSPSPPPI